MKYQSNRLNNSNLLQLENIKLNYGKVTALNDINLSIGFSEVHAVVGEHGAGKSSLGMVISGMLKPERGRIGVKGKNYDFLTVQTSLNLGIEMIYQKIHMNDFFTVAENLFLMNNQINRFGLNKRKRFYKEAISLLSKYHFDINPSTRFKNLNLSDRTLIYILAHIIETPQILVIDEALDKLTSVDLNKMIDILLELRDGGMSILLITHRIDDVFDLADRVSIMKSGRILLTDYVNNVGRINLIKMAYTQIKNDQNSSDINRIFYELLKYNEAILEKLPVNLIVTDNENKIKMVNDYCKDYFQLEDIEYLDIHLGRLFTEDNIEVLKLIEEALSSRERKAYYHVPIILHDATTINNVKTLPIYDGKFIIGNIIIIEDITEYDKIQKQFALSEKLASIGLLAAGVAHEINNPLEIIYNYLSYIKFNFNNENLHTAIDVLHDEISNISNIVSNLLTFSDYEKFTDENTEINELIASIVNLIKKNAENKNVTIHFDPSKKNISVKSNINEIRQVILNLFKNSLEAMPSGGKIFIETGKKRENGSDFALIIFKDTGVGIDDTNLSKVFLPFYSSKKEEGQNLGLGLSVSYGIIQKYKGTIAVENNKESGCRFSIMLPLAI